MDLKYLAHKALEELDGAEEYVKMATQIQAMSKDWADKFYNLSLIETEHAKTLFLMYQELYKKTVEAYSEPPRYLRLMNSEVSEEYMDRCATVRLMQDIFKK